MENSKIQKSFPPEISEQIRIVEKLDIISENSSFVIDKYQRKLIALEELKKSILERAFRGEL